MKEPATTEVLLESGYDEICFRYAGDLHVPHGARLLYVQFYKSQ